MKVETNPQVSPGFGADDAVGPVATAVGLLKSVDRAMAGVLRAIAISQPEAGMPADRLISLAASATGWDVAYLARATDVLDCMPATWQAFDEGRLSWSQLRGIIAAAKRLSRDERAQLDWRLTGAISHNPDGEPDALVEHAHTIATQLTDQRTADAELSSTRRQFVRFQPDLFGGVDFWGFADELTAATMKAAMDAAADAPRLADEPSVDMESQLMPATWFGYSSRDSQLLEGLRRVCVAYLAGASGDDPDSVGQSRPDMHVVVDIAQLLKACDSDGVGLVTSRVLWSIASGRTAASTARISQLACDANRIPVLTDGDTILAVGDSHDPIPRAVRRAARVRDQGCRFPGCRAPAAYTDLHHITPREHGGPTSLSNLISLCRMHHTMVHRRGWILDLDSGGMLTVRRGRWRFTSRPRLRPPPPTCTTQGRGTSTRNPEDRTPTDEPALPF